MNTKEFSLKLGESVRVRPGVFRMSVNVVYTGMVSDHTGSLAVQSTMGHNSWAYNLYFTRDARQVGIPKGTLDILEFTSTFLRFRTNMD